MGLNKDDRWIDEISGQPLTRGQHFADKLAEFIGSWPFLIGQTIFLIAWIVLNITGLLFGIWDRYPFILLNLILSFQAAYAGPLILISQNRLSDRDRFQAKADYLINMEAHRKIERLEVAIGLIESDKLDKILELLHERKEAERE